MSVPRLRDWQRILAGCVTLWMAVMSADLPTLHACAMHSVGAVPGADARMGGMSGMSGASADQRGQRAASAVDRRASREEAGRGHESSAPTHRQCCTCIGPCCGCAVLAIPTAQAAARRELVSHASPVATRLARVISPWAGFALPFATAPPSA